MAAPKELLALINSKFEKDIVAYDISHDLLTLEVKPTSLLPLCRHLKEEKTLLFEALMDLCGVDYLHYGQTEWQTCDATETGYGRGVQTNQGQWEKARYCVVSHLLSYTHNHRLRLKVFLDGEPPKIDSLTDIWNAANWYEREAFDLFGILFDGHPDLRRIVTDYGFMGHPFRKDFPLSGKVEVRYDPMQKRVIYQPVSIEPRTLVPRVIRDDKRYCDPLEEKDV